MKKGTDMKKIDSDQAYIAALQEIQKTNHPTSVEWLKASKELGAMFKKMAAKQAAAR